MTLSLALALVGVATAVYGLALIYVPLGWIGAGVLLAVAGLTMDVDR